jgi:outer membrane protein
MKHYLTFVFLLIFTVCPRIEYSQAETLMPLFRTAIAHFPSIESFRNKEQSIRLENKALGWQRVLDVDLTTNYSHLSTEYLGKYFNGFIGIVNNFDIFNKKSTDRKINLYEGQINKSLSDTEKKNIFILINEAYFSYLKNSRLMEIHKESLDWIDKNIILANSGFEKGILPEVEINRWNIEKINCLNSIESDKLEIARADATLRILTGLDSLKPEDMEITGYTELTEENMLKNSPELVVYEMEKKQTEIEISKERLSRLPDLQIENSLVRDNEPQSTGDQYVISANLNFKLFDGGRIYRIMSDRAKIKSIENEEKAARAILTEIYRNRITEMNTRNEIMTNLKTSVDISAENLGKLLAGYRKKFVDFNTVFSAFREDVTLRENHVNASMDFNQSYQYLYHLSLGDIYF